MSDATRTAIVTAAARRIGAAVAADCLAVAVLDLDQQACDEVVVP